MTTISTSCFFSLSLVWREKRFSLFSGRHGPPPSHGCLSIEIAGAFEWDERRSLFILHGNPFLYIHLCVIPLRPFSYRSEVHVCGLLDTRQDSKRKAANKERIAGKGYISECSPVSKPIKWLTQPYRVIYRFSQSLPTQYAKLEYSHSNCKSYEWLLTLHWLEGCNHEELHLSFEHPHRSNQWK